MTKLPSKLRDIHKKSSRYLEPQYILNHAASRLARLVANRYRKVVEFTPSGMGLKGETFFSFENQRSIAKFLFLEGHNTAEIYRNLALGKDTVHKWCKHFKKGNCSVKGQGGNNRTSGHERQNHIATTKKGFSRKQRLESEGSIGQNWLCVFDGLQNYSPNTKDTET